MMVSPEWVPLHLGLNASLFLRRTELGRLPPGVVPLHLLRYSQDLGWTRGWYAGIVRDLALRAQLLTELEAAHRRGESPLYYRILDQIAALDPAYADELAARIGAHSR
ncbi:MAG: hypothetical protein KC731_05835 [Myxococcales bacterium]|nr:hypothetical protein [Myxococcales bacterium]